MSCCCCCVSPGGELLDGIRKKERLVRREEEEQQEDEEEQSRRSTMDVSLLRQQYRSSRDTQRRHTQVLLLRTVSEAVTQELSSPWEPNSCSPPAVTFDPERTSCDPWHVHLSLHRHCPGTTAPPAASSPETSNTNSSSQRSSSSSESACRNLSVDAAPDSPCSTTEQDQRTSARSRAGTEPRDPEPVDPEPRDPEPGDPESRDAEPGDPEPGSSDRPSADPEKVDPVQVSDSSDPPERSGSDDSSPPAPPAPPAPSSLPVDLKAKQSAGSTSVWRDGRKFSAPGLRFTRQLSVGGVGHQNQNYHPFPSRKPPRISEAARRLGMYSSF